MLKMRINAHWVCIFVVSMDNWNEVKTAYQVAKLGSLSAAAKQLGVHRATVMRHIDSLEKKLGVALFQRSDKGYLANQAGLELMQIAEVTQAQFSHIQRRFKSQEEPLCGCLTITSVDELAEQVMPVVQRYLSTHEQMQVEFIGDTRSLNLQYGEADIAIRAGVKPTTPDNIVFALSQESLRFFAHRDYVAKYGKLETEAQLSQHRFLAIQPRTSALAWNEWLLEKLPQRNIAVSCTSYRSLLHALQSGCGIGVLPLSYEADYPHLIAMPLEQSWQINLWGLVHRDVYRLPKVYQFVQLLKEYFANPSS